MGAPPVTERSHVASEPLDARIIGRSVQPLQVGLCIRITRVVRKGQAKIDESAPSSYHYQETQYMLNLTRVS